MTALNTTTITINLTYAYIFQHITLIFLILAGILHLANIVFMPCEDTDGVSVVDEYPLHAVAKLLGIEDEVQLTEAMISTVSHIKGKHRWVKGWLVELTQLNATLIMTVLFITCVNGKFKGYAFSGLETKGFHRFEVQTKWNWRPCNTLHVGIDFVWHNLSHFQTFMKPR